MWCNWLRRNRCTQYDLKVEKRGEVQSFVRCFPRSMRAASRHCLNVHPKAARIGAHDARHQEVPAEPTVLPLIHRRRRHGQDEKNCRPCSLTAQGALQCCCEQESTNYETLLARSVRFLQKSPSIIPSWSFLSAKGSSYYQASKFPPEFWWIGGTPYWKALSGMMEYVNCKLWWLFWTSEHFRHIGLSPFPVITTSICRIWDPFSSLIWTTRSVYWGEIALGDESESVCSRQQRCGSLVAGWLEFLAELMSIEQWIPYESCRLQHPHPGQFHENYFEPGVICPNWAMKKGPLFVRLYGG